MTVYRKNITINVGETFSEDLTLLSADGTGVVDLSGFTGESKLRKHPQNPQFADIQVGISSTIQGQINISIASTVTKFFRSGRHVYDIVLTRPSGSKFVAGEGNALIRACINTIVHYYGAP